MANIVIWMAILLTISTVSQAVNISAITHVECTKEGSVVTLDLTGISPRPTILMAIVNGLIKESACKVVINTTIDVSYIPVNFSTCNITPKNTGTTASQPQTEFRLSIVHKPEFVSEGDLLVPIVCSDVNVGTVNLTRDVEQRLDNAKGGENEILANPTNIKMAFEDSAGTSLTSSVQLGAEIILQITAAANISFEVTGCTVESSDESYNRIGPYNVSHGGCTVDTDLLTDFTNENGPQKISKSTVSAFRLVGQAQMRPVMFKCTLRWCEHDNGVCKHEDGTACRSTRRRRRQASDVFDRNTDERTVRSLVYVSLPGFVKPTTGTSTRTGLDYVVKMAVLLYCGLRYLLQ